MTASAPTEVIWHEIPRSTSSGPTTCPEVAAPGASIAIPGNIASSRFLEFRFFDFLVVMILVLMLGMFGLSNQIACPESLVLLSHLMVRDPGFVMRHCTSGHISWRSSGPSPHSTMTSILEPRPPPLEPRTMEVTRPGSRVDVGSISSVVVKPLWGLRREVL